MFIDSPFKEIQNTPEEYDENFVETMKDSQFAPSKGIYEFKKNLFPKDDAPAKYKLKDVSDEEEEDYNIEFLNKVGV